MSEQANESPVTAEAGETDAVNQIHQGLSARRQSDGERQPAADTRAAAAATVAADAPPANDQDKPPAGDAGDVESLRRKVAELESREKQRTAHLDGEYAKATFIAQEDPKNGLPIALLQKWLPATTDKTILSKARDELSNLVNQVIGSQIAAGKLKSLTDFGGVSREGGTTPNKTPVVPGGNATSLIAEGLHRRPSARLHHNHATDRLEDNRPRPSY